MSTIVNFNRFVRFVNTPAIIERFATLEKEILQIENSIEANEIANAADTEHLQDGIIRCFVAVELT